MLNIQAGTHRASFGTDITSTVCYINGYTEDLPLSLLGTGQYLGIYTHIFAPALKLTHLASEFTFTVLLLRTYLVVLAFVVRRVIKPRSGANSE
jgi:hypothetical protein